MVNHCFQGTGELAQFNWRLQAVETGETITVTYFFHQNDPTCKNPHVATTIEKLTNGCFRRKTGRGTRYSIQDGLPYYPDGVVYYGYKDVNSCVKDEYSSRVAWSYVRNGRCDPQVFSPITGMHELDESRLCDASGHMSYVVYNSKDSTCNTIVENEIPLYLQCNQSSVTGGELIWNRPLCAF